MTEEPTGTPAAEPIGAQSARRMRARLARIGAPQRGGTNPVLEPLFRCNLACAGCGKIQYPGQILRKNLTVEQCLTAVAECGAPIVSIPGGEPLMYPDIGRLVKELVARKKYVYLCTNAILLKEKLEAGLFTPSKYLSFSIHMDGLREEHDQAVCRDGVYDKAVEAIREALRAAEVVITIDRNCAAGSHGVLYDEIRSALYGAPRPPRVAGVIAGLGGRDVTVRQIKEVTRRVLKQEPPFDRGEDAIDWLGLDRARVRDESPQARPLARVG